MSAAEGERWGFHNRLVDASALRNGRWAGPHRRRTNPSPNGITKTQLNPGMVDGAGPGDRGGAQAQAICIADRRLRNGPIDAFVARQTPVFRSELTPCSDRAPTLTAFRARQASRRREQMPDFLLQGFDYPRAAERRRRSWPTGWSKGLRRQHRADRQCRQRTLGADWTGPTVWPDPGGQTTGVRPGNRVLIGRPNNPAMVACWLAAPRSTPWW